MANIVEMDKTPEYSKEMQTYIKAEKSVPMEIAGAQWALEKGYLDASAPFYKDGKLDLEKLKDPKVNKLFQMGIKGAMIQHARDWAGIKNLDEHKVNALVNMIYGIPLHAVSAYVEATKDHFSLDGMKQQFEKEMTGAMQNYISNMTSMLTPAQAKEFMQYKGIGEYFKGKRVETTADLSRVIQVAGQNEKVKGEKARIVDIAGNLEDKI